MISRTALYDFLDETISNAASTDALYGAESFRSFRGDIGAAKKVVRVDIIEGVMVVTTDSMRKEMGVRFTAQFFVTPDSDKLTDLDAAKDESFDMAREFFDALHANQSLNGAVCLADADAFETGEANLGATLRGVTYLDGEVNPLGEG